MITIGLRPCLENPIFSAHLLSHAIESSDRLPLRALRTLAGIPAKHMNTRDLRNWMWGDALDLMDRAERLQRQFFQPKTKPAGAKPVWQPPVDIYETDREVEIRVALPGVAAENLQIGYDGHVLSVVAERALPSRDHAAIRRLEIPYGRFERHIEWVGNGLELLRQELINGCLVLRFAKGS